MAQARAVAVAAVRLNRGINGPIQLVHEHLEMRSLDDEGWRGFVTISSVVSVCIVWQLRLFGSSIRPVVFRQQAAPGLLYTLVCLLRRLP